MVCSHLICMMIIGLVAKSISQSLQHFPISKYDLWEHNTEKALNICGKFSGAVLADCIVNELSPDVNKLTEAMNTMMKTTSQVSGHLRNYTCEDESLDTSKPIFSIPFDRKNSVYNAQFLLNMTHAKVWLIENFVTNEECATLNRVGRPKLRRATVAAEDGTSVVSEHRKAQQASYDYHQQNLDKDPLW
jgi:hypothetical protein